IQIKVQKEVYENFNVEGTLDIEIVKKNLTCPQCHRAEADDYWKCQVQIRQKVNHRRTFYYLEQILLKNKLTHEISSIEKTENGINLFYQDRNAAVRMTNFIVTKVPCKLTNSQQLISEDIKNNAANIKHTICLEIVPICKESVVFLPKKIAQKHGNIARVCICTKVSSNLHFLDPTTKQKFWASPFKMLSDIKSLQRYIVLDIDYNYEKGYRKRDFGNKKSKNSNQRPNHHLADQYTLCEVTLIKENSDGQPNSNCIINAISHLSKILYPGDVVLCYDFSTCNDDEAIEYQMNRQSRIIVVKKFDENKQKERKRHRAYMLKRIAKNSASENDSDLASVGSSIENDFEEFLNELEEDEEMRKNVQLFKDPVKIASLERENKLEILSKYTDVKLTELMDDLNI
ncbi:MAG: ribosome-binding protein, partial [Paramarteilia canceri]